MSDENEESWRKRPDEPENKIGVVLKPYALLSNTHGDDEMLKNDIAASIVLYDRYRERERETCDKGVRISCENLAVRII